MTVRQRIAGLASLSELILDLHLGQLRKAKQAREQTAARISDLQAEPAEDGLSLIAARQAEIRYGIWADGRRRELNTILARQTAEMLIAEDSARLAFGRLEALRRIREKLD